MTLCGIDKHMQLGVFKWDEQIPIGFIRIEALNRLYAFDCQRHDELFFKAVSKGGHRGCAQMLKSWRAKHKYSQKKAAGKLHVSQPAIAKYETGGKIMPLGVALMIEDINNGRELDEARYGGLMCDKVFKLKTHILLMRIEVGEKHYCCHTHRRNRLVFKAVPKPDNVEGKALKEWREKYHLTQAQAGKGLGVSQGMIAKYESGERIFDGTKLKTVRLMLRLSREQIKEWLAYHKNVGIS